MASIKRSLNVIAVIVLTCILLSFVSKIVELKDSYITYGPFYQEELNHDVLFYGTSHMNEAIFPTILWHDYGITSYNMGEPGTMIPSAYWQIVNTLDYSTPKLIVVDGFNAKSEDVVNSFSHRLMDFMPMSKNKIRTVFDLTKTAKERMEYLWNFSIYHSRWNDLSKDDFEAECSHSLGARAENSMSKGYSHFEPMTDVYLEKDTAGLRYLARILDECRERDIDVLLTYIPVAEGIEDAYAEANTLGLYAEKYNVDYLNFMSKDMMEKNILDLDVDMDGGQSHLNVMGACKFTHYIAKYIRDNYDIEDHRNDAAYAGWDENYNEYLKEMNGEFDPQVSIVQVLMPVSITGYSADVYYNENYKQDVYEEKLFKYLGDKLRIHKTEGLIDDRADMKIVIYNDIEGREICTKYFSGHDMYAI